jgi:hypothetical protein
LSIYNNKIILFIQRICSLEEKKKTISLLVFDCTIGVVKSEVNENIDNVKTCSPVCSHLTGYVAFVMQVH